MATTEETSNNSSMTVSPSNIQKRIGIITGATRGIGRGITERLASWLDIVVLTYNTDATRAQQVADELRERYHNLQTIELVSGDLSEEATRDAIFACVDRILREQPGSHLQVCVHNAGQYVGITADNSANLKSANLQYGNGSLVQKDGHVNLEMAHYYHRLYGEAWIDLCERSLVRMKATEVDKKVGVGSLIGISSPGCNLTQPVNRGYSMPGTGKSLMEHSMRIYAWNAAEYGVNCNVIIPGAVETEAWARLQETRGADVLATMSKKAPLGQAPIQPTDIGDVASFLAQPNGGGHYITGVSLPVDAGLSVAASWH